MASTQQRNLPRKILVCVALGAGAKNETVISERDRSIARYAMRLGHMAGSEVRFFHAVEWDEDNLEHPTVKKLETERGAVLAALHDLQAGHGRVAVSSALRFGRPWFTIIQEAVHWGAELIIVGSQVHDVGLIGRMLHGTTAGRLIRKSPVPVLRVGDHVPEKLERILVPVDFTPVSAELVSMANEIHKETGAERVLLHCLQFPLDIAVHHEPNPDEAVRKYHADVTEKAQVNIDKLLGADREKWQVILKTDWIGRVAPEVVVSERIDLMIIAGISLPRVAGLLLGTTAEKIIERTDVPTYMMKKDGWKSTVVV